MKLSEKLADWVEYVWNAPGEDPGAQTLRGRHAHWRREMEMLQKPGAYRSPHGGVAVPQPRHMSGIDWREARLDAGAAVDEKLYYGFVSSCPEVHVPDHHRRRRPGSPVYVDGVPLERQIFFDEDGELASAEQEESAVESGADEDGNYHLRSTEGKDIDVPAGVVKALLRTGSSIYDRDRRGGEEELALNVLNDCRGWQTAERFYAEFASEVINALPRVELSPFVDVDSPHRFHKYAEWYLKSSDIESWLDERA